eukprot:UN02582
MWNTQPEIQDKILCSLSGEYEQSKYLMFLCKYDLEPIANTIFPILFPLSQADYNFEIIKLLISMLAFYKPILVWKRVLLYISSDKYEYQREKELKKNRPGKFLIQKMNLKLI